VPSVRAELRDTFGDIDIYVFDQLLRGRFDTRPRVLDAGCGDGRNVRFLLARGFTVSAVDRDANAIAHARRLAATLAPGTPEDQFQVGEVDRLPFSDASMDAVICSAVLHFADDESHFGRMVREVWRVLAPGGLLFTRLASNIGLESVVGPGGRRARLPDGSDRFIADEEMLMSYTASLGGQLADPLKTTVVQGRRSMTTWCVERGL
jgi:tellurite methyltransferase